MPGLPASDDDPQEAHAVPTERMANVDAAWLRMEEAVNQMTITAVFTFSAPVALDDFRRIIEERFLVFDRFRQRVRRGGGPLRNPRWEPDPRFDLTRHVRPAQVPAPGGKAELQTLVGQLMSRPLDFSRPLWEFHVARGCAEGGAVVARLHHCIADGVTLIRVLLSLADPTPGEAPPDLLAASPEAGEGAPPSMVRRFTKQLRRAGRKGAQTAAMVGRSAVVLGKLAWPSTDPDTPFRGPLGRHKKAAWSDSLKLADVKAVGRRLGGTVNDVMLTAATGALRRYLEAHEAYPGVVPPGLDLRAAVPVNLRPSGEQPITMGNTFGLVFLALPVGVADPRERMAVLRARMDRLKRSPEALMVLGLLGAVGSTTRAVEDQVVRYLARKLTAVATNVPGPQDTLHMTGAPMETFMAWVPQAGRVGLGLSIVSYDGDVRFGVVTDANLVSDPEAIANVFVEAFEALRGEEMAAASGDRLERAEPGEAADGEPDDSDPDDSDDQDGGEPDPSPGAYPERCQATTKAGTQCKLPAQDASRFCHVHR